MKTRWGRGAFWSRVPFHLAMFGVGLFLGRAVTSPSPWGDLLMAAWFLLLAILFKRFGG